MKNSIVKFFVSLHEDQDGQGMVEYLLITAAIVLVAVTASGTLANRIGNAMGVVGNKITNAVT